MAGQETLKKCPPGRGQYGLHVQPVTVREKMEMHNIMTAHNIALMEMHNLMAKT